MNFRDSVGSGCLGKAVWTESLSGLQLGPSVAGLGWPIVCEVSHYLDTLADLGP